MQLLRKLYGVASEGFSFGFAILRTNSNLAKSLGTKKTVCGCS